MGAGDPGRIRTCSPQSRNLMLYPVELRDRLGRDLVGGMPVRPNASRRLHSTANMKNPLSRQDRRTDFLNLATKADGGPSLPVRT